MAPSAIVEPFALTHSAAVKKRREKAEKRIMQMRQLGTPCHLVLKHESLSSNTYVLYQKQVKQSQTAPSLGDDAAT